MLIQKSLTPLIIKRGGCRRKTDTVTDSLEEKYKPDPFENIKCQHEMAWETQKSSDCKFSSEPVILLN